MFKDEGTRSSKQVQGTGVDGSIKNFIIDDNGNLKVIVGGNVNGSVDVNNAIEIDDETPVRVQSVGGEIETTLVAGKEALTSKTLTINKKVTSISIANYSEDNSITVTVGQKSFVIGQNIATDLPINAEVSTIVITATTSTEVQYIVKGVE